MSAAGEPAFAIDGRPVFDTGSPTYFFDLAPVLERCEGLRRNPERAALMCKNHVRMLAPGELMIPRGSGFYLVMQTRGGAAADALARDVSIALLRLFFGTDCFNGIASLFRAVSPGEMVQAGIGIGAPPARAPQAPARAPQAAAPPPKPGSVLVPLDVPALQYGFLPMRNIQNEGPGIHLCGIVAKREGKLAFGSAALKGCDPKVRPSLDVAVLHHALSQARQIVPSRAAAALCVPVSFETLAWSRGRRRYQQALQEAQIADNPFVIVKIDDVPRGIRGARLAEIVATVRPFVRRVFLHVPDIAALPSHGGYFGAAGLCATLPATGSQPATANLLRVFARRLVQAAHTQRAVACVDGAAPGEWHLLRAAGIRFAAGRYDTGVLDLDQASAKTRAA